MQRSHCTEYGKKEIKEILCFPMPTEMLAEAIHRITLSLPQGHLHVKHDNWLEQVLLQTVIKIYLVGAFHNKLFRSLSWPKQMSIIWSWLLLASAYSASSFTPSVGSFTLSRMIWNLHRSVNMIARPSETDQRLTRDWPRPAQEFQW